MCLTVYVASSRPLRYFLDEERYSFLHARELLPSKDAPRQPFSKPYVYHVTSSRSCGCCFQCSEGADDENWTHRKALVAYLERALSIVPEVELFVCWEGDEESEPVSRDWVSTQDLLLWRTRFEERELLTIVRES